MNGPDLELAVNTATQHHQKQSTTTTAPPPPNGLGPQILDFRFACLGKVSEKQQLPSSKQKRKTVHGAHAAC